MENEIPFILPPEICLTLRRLRPEDFDPFRKDIVNANLHANQIGSERLTQNKIAGRNLCA